MKKLHYYIVALFTVGLLWWLTPDSGADLNNWNDGTNSNIRVAGILAQSITNSARTASTFVVAGSDKADTSTGTSAMLAATLSDETGTGSVVFGTGPTLTPPVYIGGTSSSFPMLTNSGATLVVRVADNSANAGLTANSVSATGANSAFAGISLGSNAGLFSGTGPKLNFSASNFGDSALTLELGVATAAPSAHVLKTADGSGTDKAGSMFTIQAGASTGAGVPGDLIYSTSLYTNGSGSTVNAVTTRGRIVGRPCALTNATATSFQRFTMATNTQAGIHLFCTVTSTDASFNKQSISSSVRVDAVNVSGTITATATETDNTLAANTGTLTIAYTVVDEGSNVLAIRANANSSLTTPTVKIKWVIQSINSDGAITVTPVQL